MNLKYMKVSLFEISYKKKKYFFTIFLFFLDVSVFPEPGRVAYNAGLLKGCFYKVGQFILSKDSLALLTQSL